MHLSQRELFLNYLAPTSDSPLLLEIVESEGIYLIDAKGKKYIDLISGIAVSNVGHRNPHVVNAIKNQLDKFMHTMVYGEYVQSPQVLLAQKLIEISNSPKLEQVYFTNSGTEATEGAMKLAKRFTGRTEIISCFNAYHGATQGALSLAGSEDFKNSFRPLLPDIKHIRHGEIDDLGKISKKTAAVIIEIVGGEAGVHLAEKSYFKALESKCKETGTLLIIDEIQTGFGRTGNFWAFQSMNIHPDIILTAKGMGGGMPIGAFIASKNLMQAFTNNPVLGHITTFGGHPVSCAASLATIEVILNQKLMDQIPAKEALFKSLLTSPKIRAIRSAGLMMAVEFDNFDQLKGIINRCIEKGVITDWFLFNDKCLRIAPPLIISDEEIKIAAEIINQSF
ncbi:MAG: 4-aminobutyrate--2-oxoglutarate transaminase [Bacteroidota bacterium]|jgi:acetylornithine/succinyldiaminopimelate/putrescine aminotransferase